MGWLDAWWATLTVFEKALWVIAVPSSALTLAQAVLGAIGLSGHGDADGGGADTHLDVHGGDDAAHDHAPSLRLFSVKGVVIFFTAFSWMGIIVSGAGLPAFVAAGVGLVTGVGFMFLFAWVFYGLSRLEESGTFDIKTAMYQRGRVYLRIPGKRAGAGKVTAAVQGSLRELRAVTDGEEIGTGAPIQIVDIVDKETVLVALDK
jgi:hypothetical protein